VDHESTTILEGAIAKQVKSTAKKCGRPIDVVRLLAIYLNCYAIPKADLKAVLSFVPLEEEREILE
jgi:hypothetical protein